MIALADNCLVFQLATGESIPFSPEMLSLELMGEAVQSCEPEFVEQAAHAVFHYFKRDLGRTQVTIGEFSEALEKVLNGFKLSSALAPASEVAYSDLAKIAGETGPGSELFFFPRLRDELKSHLSGRSRLLHFYRLRPAVKNLAGAQRWSARCESLKESILAFLRQCATAEAGGGEISIVVQ